MTTTGRYRSGWLADESPGPTEAEHCRKCGRLMERVGPTPCSWSRFDDETGAPVYEWRVECPVLRLPRLARLFAGDHDSHGLTRYVDYGGAVETISW